MLTIKLSGFALMKFEGGLMDLPYVCTQPSLRGNPQKDSKHGGVAQGILTLRDKMN